MENNEVMMNEEMNNLTESNTVDLVDGMLNTMTKPSASIGTFAKAVAVSAGVSITAGVVTMLGMKLVEAGVTFVGNKISNYKEKKKLKKNSGRFKWGSSDEADNVEIKEFKEAK